MTRLGFIGGGNMAEALIAGIIKAKLVDPGRVYVSDIKEERWKQLSTRYRIKGTRENTEVARECDTIIICVKPSNVREVLEEIAGNVGDHLVITIAAGVSIKSVEGRLGRSVPVIRAMPNTPALVMEAATGIARGIHATQAHIDTVLKIFNSIGTAVVVDEARMDAVTAVSGSGPAYVFYMIEALIEAAIEEGLAPADARELAVQTVCGAARMASSMVEEPAELRRKVTSPGGTTEAAIKVLDEKEWKKIMHEAVKAAKARSEEMAQSS